RSARRRRDRLGRLRCAGDVFDRPRRDGAAQAHRAVDPRGLASRISAEDRRGVRQPAVSPRRRRVTVAKRIAAWLMVLLAAPAAFAIEAELGFDDPVMNERYRTLLREIRCPKCLNTSIADSDAPIAADLRREVHQKMAEGN